ncbi:MULTISPECIES: mannitol-1-phosphate 5-dehydrogenase [Anaerococcus]|uniref:Mannitol-1-phosphate 5-dehydrogenase n=1 Tax=Anaerococcus kampingae TaxID=3115614 RepID=A0ABW9MEW2_9FIRM|nr:mannitol-1-phosphate 5-dehydrogenase [Anaerococcus sp. Marseille-P3915]
MTKAIQFGAGNIGRGFIGYLLKNAGYDLVFADVFDNVIDLINKEKAYTIHVKDVENEDIKVEGISAVNSTRDEIVDEIADAAIITTAVGPLNLVKIAGKIASGIEKRFEADSDKYLNIIACENAIKASESLKGYVYEKLDDEAKAYADKYVGFPNCSVDRIVPPSKNENPLDVTVENYYEWNVEEAGFKGEIPQIEGMNLVGNLEAYIERKLFTLNTGHASTAYLGSLKAYGTIDESINDPEIEDQVRKIMQESGEALIAKFGFNKEDHFAYIEKIIKRFKNPYLKDDVKRVGREPIRKLSVNERFVKPINTALEYKLPVDNLLVGLAAALNFRNNEDGQAVELEKDIENLGLEKTVEKITEIKDEKIIEKIKEIYEKLNK